MSSDTQRERENYSHSGYEHSSWTLPPHGMSKPPFLQLKRGSGQCDHLAEECIEECGYQ